MGIVLNIWPPAVLNEIHRELKEVKKMADDTNKLVQDILDTEVETQKDVQRVSDALVGVRSQVVDLQKQVADLQAAIANGASDPALLERLQAIKTGLTGIDQIAEAASPEVVVPPPAPTPAPTA